MAESDTAGPAPRGGPPAASGPRSFTLADIQRDLDRATAPLRKAQRQAERSLAPVLAIAKEMEERQRQFYALLDNGIGRALREAFGRPSSAPFGLDPVRHLARDSSAPAEPVRPSPRPETPATATLPASPPLSPGEIRAALGPVLKEVVEQLVADVKRILAEPQKPQTKRGDSTSERLRALFEEDPEFAICRTLEEIGTRIGRKKSSIAGKECHYYHSKLKPLREKKTAAVALAANDAARRLPSNVQATRAMRDHRSWQAAVDEAIDRDGGSHLDRAT
jgi:hypothetical protein